MASTWCNPFSFLSNSESPKWLHSSFPPSVFISEEEMFLSFSKTSPSVNTLNPVEINEGQPHEKSKGYLFWASIARDSATITCILAETQGLAEWESFVMRRNEHYMSLSLLSLCAFEGHLHSPRVPSWRTSSCFNSSLFAPFLYMKVHFCNGNFGLLLELPALLFVCLFPQIDQKLPENKEPNCLSLFVPRAVSHTRLSSYLFLSGQ